ncbi:MAG: hypothetical protein ACJ798_17080 [Phenylobacterium sp.]
MILHLSPDAPWIARAAADTALVAHIGGGMLGIAAGFVALAARKGETIHRAAGKAFLVAMLVALAVGAVVAPLIHQPANTLGALFAIYLLVTAWGTVKRPDGAASQLGIGATRVAAAAAVGLAAYALLGALEPRVLPGLSSQLLLGNAIFVGVVAAADRRVLRRELTGANRLARHLWRMCLAMFVATGSLFLGQPKVFPIWLRGSPILWILALAPLAAMVFWLIRIRSKRPARPVRPIAPAQEALS